MRQSILNGTVDCYYILGFQNTDLLLWDELKAYSDIAADKMHFVDCCMSDTDYVIYLVQGAKFNIGSRFHQAVFSLSAGVPTLSFYFDEYYKNKLTYIHQQFSSSNVLFINDLIENNLYSFIQSLPDIKCNIIASFTDVNKKLNKKLQLLCDFYSKNDSEKKLFIERLNAAFDMPKVSLIIPVYNMEKYITDCLDSILEQSLTEIEVICINDGSTDNSLAILQEYCHADSRIIIINQKNKGVAAARNAGIKLAKGEFLFFIDPDDWLHDNRVLEDLYVAAKENKVLVCGGGFCACTPNDIVYEWSGSASKYQFKDEGVIKYADYQFDYGWVRFIYNREFILRNNLFIPKLSFFEDPVFFVRTLTLAKEFYALKRCVYCYRTGYKELLMPFGKVKDLLTGLYTNMCIAKENNYWDLLLLEKERIENDFAEYIYPYLIMDGESEIKMLINKINIVINDNNDRIEYNIFNKVHQREKQEAIQEAIHNTLAMVEESTTWKVGNLMLIVPKKVKAIFSGGR